MKLTTIALTLVFWTVALYLGVLHPDHKNLQTIAVVGLALCTANLWTQLGCR